MSYNVIFARSFKLSLTELERRFRNVKEDARVAIRALSENPNLGVVIPGGVGIRKLRVRNSDLARGKSGGYRLLYWVGGQPEPTVYLLLLYFKGDRGDVTRDDLQQLLDDLAGEIGSP